MNMPLTNGLMDIKSAIRFILSIENLQSKQELDAWCGDQGREKLFDKKMTIANKFAVMTGLPEYGERANTFNVNIDDVITYRVKGYWVFSIVIGTTPTMIQVIDLFCENTIDGVNLYINRKQNSTTKCLLHPARRIFKVTNINRL